jgi:hypothetical protein
MKSLSANARKHVNRARAGALAFRRVSAALSKHARSLAVRGFDERHVARVAFVLFLHFVFEAFGGFALVALEGVAGVVYVFVSGHFVSLVFFKDSPVRIMLACKQAEPSVYPTLCLLARIIFPASTFLAGKDYDDERWKRKNNRL